MNQERYKIFEKLGSGTYGVVYKCEDQQTKQMCALKKIKLLNKDEGVPSTAIREISILQEVHSHPNIVTLLDIESDVNHLNLIFELVEFDLKQYMKLNILSPQIVKSFLYQLLLSIQFCHENRILHRDLKPQNILVSNNGTIKLADFGLARAYSFPAKTYTHEIVTLWYRSPEILMGQQIYSTSVDIWSIGCIFAEMNLKEPLFLGDCEIDQLFQIFQQLGTPNEDSWKGVSNLPDYKPTFPSWKMQDLKQLIPNMNIDALDLLHKMLQLNPSKRISSQEALHHTYFDDLDKSKYFQF